MKNSHSWGLSICRIEWYSLRVRMRIYVSLQVRVGDKLRVLLTVSYGISIFQILHMQKKICSNEILIGNSGCKSLWHPSVSKYYAWFGFGVLCVTAELQFLKSLVLKSSIMHSILCFFFTAILGKNFCFQKLHYFAKIGVHPCLLCIVILNLA